jgi:hypothetical protein
MRAGFQVAVAWRFGVLACLVVAMAIRLADARQIFKLRPGDILLWGELVTSYVWQFAVVIALTARAAPRRRVAANTWGNTLVSTLVVVGAVAIGLYMLFYMGTVTFLVHVACSGIDAGHINADFRYPAISWETRDQFTYLSTAMVGVLAIAGVALTRAFPIGDGRSINRRWLALAGVGLATCAAFAYWFECQSLPKLSPDLEEGGFGAAPWQRWAGLVLVIMLSCCAAIRAGCLTGWRSAEVVEAPVRRSAARSSLMGMALVGAMAVELFRQSGVLDYGWVGLADMLTNPAGYLAAAVLVLAARSLWQAWGRSGDIGVVEIAPLDPRRFALSWAAMGAWLSVAAFTLAAAQFLFWQGSWFEW